MENREILISVIMSSYNEDLKQIERSTDSILSQDYKNIEFIIVLDNPNNQNLLSFLKKLEYKDKRVKLIINEKNIWLWFSLNKAIKASKWDYIARMDWDDISNKTRLSKQLNFLLLNKNIDVLFTWYNKYFSNWNSILYLPPEKQKIENMLFDWYSFLHASIMTRKENYSKYNYNLTQNPEEFDLFFRMIKWWLIFYTLNEDLYTYFIYKKSDLYRFRYVSSWTKDFFYLLVRNFLYFIWYKKFLIVFIKTFIWYTLSRNKNIFNFIVKLKDKIQKTY